MPMFKIVAGYSTTPKDQWEPVKWGIFDPKAETDLIRQWNKSSREIGKQLNKPPEQIKRYMLIRVPSEQDFVAREQAREDYKPFEVQGAQHHCAELKGDKVSFYNDYAAGEDNKRTEMRLGRYLRRFTQLSDNEVADICARNGVECGDMSMKIAQTREEIRHVYVTGPRSCMSGSVGDGIHPVEAYAGPDTAVAYIIRDERITARAVINTRDKLYGCIYGDKLRLEPLLQAEGYTEHDDPIGNVRLLRIEHDYEDCYVYPYLDTESCYVHEDDDPQYLRTSDIKGAYGGDYGKVRISSTQSDRLVDDTCYFEDQDYDDYDDTYYET